MSISFPSSGTTDVITEQLDNDQISRKETLILHSYFPLFRVQKDLCRYVNIKGKHRMTRENLTSLGSSPRCKCVFVSLVYFCICYVKEISNLGQSVVDYISCSYFSRTSPKFDGPSCRRPVRAKFPVWVSGCFLVVHTFQTIQFPERTGSISYPLVLSVSKTTLNNWCCYSQFSTQTYNDMNRISFFTEWIKRDGESLQILLSLFR